jgi:hypothetical protein
MDVSRKEAENLLDKAERKWNQIKAHAAEIREATYIVVGGAISFAAPFAVALVEGRMAKDGTGHVSFVGIPVRFALGALATVGAAVDAAMGNPLDVAGRFIADAGNGWLGSFGSDLGRDVGLGLRLKAKLNVAPGALSPARERAIREAAAAMGTSLPPASTTVAGAAPARLSDADLARYTEAAPGAPA